MPRHTEPSVNAALGRILQQMMRSCNVRSENVRAILGNPGLQPDILITATGRAPVILEAEFEPARSVEDEALGRLGLKAIEDRRDIEAVIALRYPDDIATSDDLDAALVGGKLSYCVFTGNADEHDRFPESGWLEGSVSDIADFARLVSVPQSAVDNAARVLEDGIEDAVAAMDETAKLSPAVTKEIADLLGLLDVSQTRRMACAVVANAMVFHDRIGEIHPEVKKLNRLWTSDTDNPQARVDEEWSAILDINYWPIFAVARDIVNLLPTHAAARLLGDLRNTAESVTATGANYAHDLTGRVFQKLIADRKYLATFYTLPASASLLARLAVAKLDGVDWSDPEAIGGLRVGDFACGTGALLSAVYDQIASRHEQAGGDPKALHQSMMEDVLYGCDVMPSAIHITSSTLSGIQPRQGYDKSRLYNMPYGRQSDGSVALGSLELLQSSSVMTLFNTSDPARRTGSTGEEVSAHVMAELPDEGFDIVIMNPPFTSNTAKERIHIGTFAPAFAAFGNDDKTQKDMSKRLSKLKTGTCYHGHAGMASAFAALAQRKLKPGGVLALVVPLTAAAASSWTRFREMLSRAYTDIIVVSIAATKKEMSFSSETNIAELLIIARRLLVDEKPSTRAQFISLTGRPQGFAHARTMAQSIIGQDSVRQIGDGPYGGSTISIGRDISGEMIASELSTSGGVWGGVRVRDYSLAQTAYALSCSRLWLPGRESATELKITALEKVGTLGLYDLDITGRPPQGPFDKMAASSTSTYPAIWNHNAKKETRLVCQPDSQLQVRSGMEQKASTVWTTASRCHLNREFTFSSQPLSVAFTERKSIGGRVWPNVIFDDGRFDYAFVLWSNSTLGLLSYWWHSSRQQSSKAGMAIRTADSLPVLDLGALSERQLARAEEIFEEFGELDFKPAYLADADANRALLDRRVVCDLLGFNEDTYDAVRRLAAKWCAEPSVNGGKKRPKNAAFVA